MKHLLPFLIGLAVFSTACESQTEISIGSVGETMAFDKTNLEARPGQTVKLSFRNNATSMAMQHDWVLVRPGSEADVAGQGMTVGPDRGYLVEGPNVLAHTRMLKPGESDAITFKAPEQSGDYPYI